MQSRNYSPFQVENSDTHLGQVVLTPPAVLAGRPFTAAVFGSTEDAPRWHEKEGERRQRMAAFFPFWLERVLRSDLQLEWSSDIDSGTIEGPVRQVKCSKSRERCLAGTPT